MNLERESTKTLGAIEDLNKQIILLLPYLPTKTGAVAMEALVRNRTLRGCLLALQADPKVLLESLSTQPIRDAIQESCVPAEGSEPAKLLPFPLESEPSR